MTDLRILLVCTANICRSPMAEAVMKKRVANPEKIGSAGIHAPAGAPAASKVSEILARRDMRIDGHASRQFSTEIATDCDLILVMEREHRSWVARHLPALVGRTYLLGQWSDFEVSDPIGQSDERFEEAFQLIDRGVEDWCKRL